MKQKSGCVEIRIHFFLGTDYTDFTDIFNVNIH